MLSQQITSISRLFRVWIIQNLRFSSKRQQDSTNLSTSEQVLHLPKVLLLFQHFFLISLIPNCTLLFRQLLHGWTDRKRRFVVKLMNRSCEVPFFFRELLRSFDIYLIIMTWGDSVSICGKLRWAKNEKREIERWSFCYSKASWSSKPRRCGILFFHFS